MIRTENVESSGLRGSGRGVSVLVAIGKAGTVENVSGGARNRRSARKAEITIAAQQQQHKKNSGSTSSPKNRTELQPPRSILGKCLRNESSAVVQFGTATLSGLGAASTARGGEAAA